MKKNYLMRLLALLVAIVTAFTLFACNGNEEETGSKETTDIETDDQTESISDSSDTTESDSTSDTNGSSNTETESASDIDGSETESGSESETESNSELYGNGDDLKNAGTSWDSDAYALTKNSIDESKATVISAADFLAKLTDNSLKAGEVYKVNEVISLASDTEYYGNGAAVIAEKGISVKNTDGTFVTELIIKGNVTVEGSTDFTMFRADIQGGDIAVKIDAASSNIIFKSMRITAENAIAVSDGSNVSFYEAYASAANGFELNGDDNTVHGCHIVVVDRAVVAKGKAAIVRNNTIELSVDATGIEMPNAYNCLVAQNIIKNAQRSVVITNGFNTAVILNSAVSVTCTDVTNLYVVDNRFGGILSMTNTNYLICEGNTFADDGKDHTIVNVNASNINGANVVDVDARADVGVNEAVLPHTNKDLFVGMERKQKVTDASFPKKYIINDYIRQNASKSEVVIVPPGAYSAGSQISLSSVNSNTTVYAYGVYHEASQYGALLSMNGAKNINIYGLTLGYSLQSSGQVHVVEKLGSNKLRVVPAAGSVDDFGLTNTSLFGSFYDWFAQLEDGTTALYTKTSLSHTITKNNDGTMTMTLKDSSTKQYYNINVGDIITCRMSGDNKTSIGMTNSKNIKFKDTVLYGYSAALAVVASGECEKISFERWHNTVHSSPEIDKATYDKYAAWEKQYDVDLEIYQDNNGLYRGSVPRVGSVDATHIMSSKQGVNVTSSILESMTDDGSNQRSTSARLHKVVDNGDGTTTIYYKGNLTEYYFNAGSTGTSYCTHFKTGDKISIVTYTGKIFCDTTVISDAVNTRNDITFSVGGRTFTTAVYSVKVNTSNVDMSALEGIDLNDNSYKMDQKVLVDNISYNSANFKFDNVLIQNTRSRGILVKTRDVNITNCTFRNLAHTGILMSVEPVWGESTVAKNVIVDKCLFDHVGYTQGLVTRTDLSPIAIVGFGTEINESTKLPCSNISITGCKFINNEHLYAITVTSAQNVTISENTFETITFNGKKNALGISIYMNNAKDITISDNIYPDIAPSQKSNISGKNYMNVLGSDTLDENDNSLFPDNVNSAE